MHRALFPLLFAITGCQHQASFSVWSEDGQGQVEVQQRWRCSGFRVPNRCFAYTYGVQLRDAEGNAVGALGQRRGGNVMDLTKHEAMHLYYMREQGYAVVHASTGVGFEAVKLTVDGARQTVATWAVTERAFVVPSPDGAHLAVVHTGELYKSPERVKVRILDASTLAESASVEVDFRAIEPRWSLQSEYIWGAWRPDGTLIVGSHIKNVGHDEVFGDVAVRVDLQGAIEPVASTGCWYPRTSSGPQYEGKSIVGNDLNGARTEGTWPCSTP